MSASLKLLWNFKSCIGKDLKSYNLYHFTAYSHYTNNDESPLPPNHTNERLISCLTGLDSTKLVNVYLIQHNQSSLILASQTGAQPYSDTSPNYTKTLYRKFIA